MKTYINQNLTGINILPGIILAVMLSLALPGFSQSGDKGKLLQMIEQDRTTVDAVAGYNEDIQRHILQIAQTPEALNKIEELQKRSQSEFRNIIDRYNRDAQTAFYEMARYPNLISDLASNGKPSTSEVNRIVSNYPEDIQPIAQKYGRKYFDVFVRIYRLNNEIDRAFQLYLEPYSSRTRESVNVLLAHPEIVSALIDDMSFISLMGDVYSQDPRWTERYLAQVSRELAEQKEQDLDAYRNQITNDPEAYNEMLEASERFARENNEVRYINNNTPTIEVRVINNYPFWFGYPYWYSSPYWRPRPIYYHTGFYRNYHGNVIFVGLPSYHFLHWQTHYHPTLFPHLSYNYYSYYENHYANNYRNSHRPVPYQGFYRSIERNVIHNPRVNNSTLERIDKQRGHDIVRKPNRMEYGSSTVSGRGQTSGVRRSDGGGTINRQGSTTTRENVTGRRNDQPVSGRSGSSVINRSGSNTTSPGTTGTVNRRQNNTTNPGASGSGSVNRNESSTPNQGTSGGSVNRRQYNTANPGRTEGPVNRRSSESGRGTIRRETAPAVSSPEATPSSRSDQGTYINRRNNENSEYNPGSTRNTSTPSATRRGQSSSATGSGTIIQQQRSAGIPQRSERAAPAQRSAKVSAPDAPSRVERSSAPARREESSASERSSERSAPVQRESRATINEAPDRGATRETQSSSRGASSESSKETRSSRRQR